MVEIWAILLVVVATIFGALGALFLKKGSSKFKLDLSLIKNIDLILGVGFYGLATLLFIPALKGGDLSILYPIVSLSYIWAILLSMFILKEKMNRFKWFGLFFIILGVIIITV